MNPEWTPPRAINTSKPSPARIYDYILGGKDNYEVDRAAAGTLLAAFPGMKPTLVANRKFLVRAVRYVAEQGIDQFIDIGAGIPTSPNVPEVARAINPQTSVVGVDNDPLVLAHNRALVTVDAGTDTIEGDVRNPHQIFADIQQTKLIDLNRPVAVLLVAILHFVRDEDDPARIIRKLMQHTAPGSYLIVSVATSDGTAPEVVEQLEKVYENATEPLRIRSEREILPWFGSFTFVDPGLVDVHSWRPDTAESKSKHAVGGLAGVALQTDWVDEYETFKDRRRLTEDEL
ncbi:MAG: SAM-dependent methyltransferase [Carbonactinosporaceae bacterium]